MEPPYTVFSPLRDGNISWKQLFNLGRLKYRGRNLFSYSPFKVLPLSLPFSERLNIDAMNRKIIFYQLKRCVKKLDIRNPILWVFFSAQQYDYYGLFNEAITVGDFYDKFTAPTLDKTYPKEVESRQRLQDRMIEEADIIFTVSQLLYDEFKSLHKEIYVVPNGVDYESFENCAASNSKVGIYEKFRKPTIGFLGMMHYIVDFGLLDYVAESRPEWMLLLMGKDNIHVDTDRSFFNRLKKRNNVIWCGEVDRPAIPLYLRAIDVCLVPLKKLEITRYANFLKIWEYFAAGKPIVAVDQGRPYEYPALIRSVHSKEEFLKNISEALREDMGEELVKRRKFIARENSWENRAREMLGIIEETLTTKSLVHNEA